MITHLQAKISKVMNEEKVQQKRGLHHLGTTTSSLSTFQTNQKSTKTIGKWSIKVFNDNMVIHVSDQMYELNCFSKGTITKWEEINAIAIMATMPAVFVKKHTLQGRDTAKPHVREK